MDKMVLVRWIDSSGDARWLSRERAKAMKLSNCESIGYLVEENDLSMTIAQSIDREEGNYNHILMIPKTAIYEIAWLRRK